MRIHLTSCRWLILSAVQLFSFSAFQTASATDSLLLRGATIHPVSGPALNSGDVLITDGKISAIAERIEDETARVLDLTGLHLYPGLISAATELGLVEISGVRASVDLREVGDFTPEVEAWVAVNPDSELIPVARANGLTHFNAVPQGGILAGASGLMATAGWTIEDLAHRRQTGLHLYWPDHSLTLPGPNSSAKPLDEQARQRRERVLNLERFFADAEAWSRRPADSPPTPAWQAMQPVLSGQLPLMIHAHGRREIRAALDWTAARPGLRVVLVGARDAWIFAAELAQRKIGVIYTETFTLPPRLSDPYDVQFAAPTRLHKAGVTFAIAETKASDQRNLPYAAAQAAAFGLPADTALAALTLQPARLLGVDDRLGSIEPGKDATLVAATGDLLDIRSQVRHVWIKGAEQSLETRHTRLADRYRQRPQE